MTRDTTSAYLWAFTGWLAMLLPVAFLAGFYLGAISR